jgi:hypothetical protein
MPAGLISAGGVCELEVNGYAIEHVDDHGRLSACARSIRNVPTHPGAPAADRRAALAAPMASCSSPRDHRGSPSR